MFPFDEVIIYAPVFCEKRGCYANVVNYTWVPLYIYKTEGIKV